MGVYHIGSSVALYHRYTICTTILKVTVLFKLRDNYDENLFEYWKCEVSSLVGVVPGEQSTSSSLKCRK